MINNQKGKAEEAVYFDFDVETESIKETGQLLDLPLRTNLDFKAGVGRQCYYFGGEPKFETIEGKRCLKLEIKRVNIWNNFDMFNEVKPNTFYSFNMIDPTLKLQWLDKQFKNLAVKDQDIDFNKPFLSPEDAYYLIIPNPKNQEHQSKIQLEEGIYKTQYIQPKKLINPSVLSISSYKNIDTTNGRLYLELYPLRSNSKRQYIFIHSDLNYPPSLINFYIEDGILFRTDLRGIKELRSIEYNTWNIIEEDFQGSIHTSRNFYISDLTEPYYGYLRNLRIFKCLY